MAANILTDPQNFHYEEAATAVSFDEFEKLVRSRRSIRKFTPEKIPDEVVHRCLDLALLAPTSSNLQQWEFVRVVTPPTKAALAQACMGQSAASTAAELIVCVARTRTWRRNARLMLELFAKDPKVPKAAHDYYSKLVPFAYGTGPFGLQVPFKWLVGFTIGLFRPMPRGPLGAAGVRLWAEKSVALACENLMLAFRAAGYDTCPMEGFDEARVKKLLKLPRDASVVMVIGAGRRAPGGVYGPRIRFDRKLFVREV